MNKISKRTAYKQGKFVSVLRENGRITFVFQRANGLSRLIRTRDENRRVEVTI